MVFFSAPAGGRSESWTVAAQRTDGVAKMPAYLIAQHTVTDPKKFEEYRVKVGPIIAKHGGRYITKSGSHVVLEQENAVWQHWPRCDYRVSRQGVPRCLVPVARISTADRAAARIREGHAHHT
jgi:Domain of unknown function (DUF1330)